MRSNPIDGCRKLFPTALKAHLHTHMLTAAAAAAAVAAIEFRSIGQILNTKR